MAEIKKLTVNIEAALHEQLTQLASVERRTLSGQVLFMLESFLAQEETQKKLNRQKDLF
jgi:hypothetical protein